MVITVKSLTINKGKYNVVFSNDESVTGNEELILKYRLVKNKEIDESLIEEIKEDSLWFEYYDKALKYLEKGLKSENRIRLYLKDKDADEKSISKVIDRLKEINVLNDQIYFEMIADHYLRQGYGPLYIKDKGISEKIKSETISLVMSSIAEDEYIHNASMLFMKKKSQVKVPFDYQQLQKIKRYLQSRGFTYSIIEKSCKE